MKNIDVLRIQPEGSDVEAIGSESITKLLNPGADVEIVNVLHSSDIGLPQHIEGSTEVGQSE